jgi:hypothetical protein
MRQWLIRLDCGAVRCRWCRCCRCCRCCSTAIKHLHESGLSASQLLLTARVCSSGFRFPPSQSPKLTVTDMHSLTRFGNPSRRCLAGGFFGCSCPGIRQGNCTSMGPLPSGQSGEAEVWPRSPGEQAASTSSLCLPTSTRLHSHRSHRSHRAPHTLAQRRQPRTADSEMELRGAVLADHGRFQRLTGACASRARTLGSCSAEPELGSWRRSTRLNPATSTWLARLEGLAKVRVASAPGARHNSLLCSFLRQHGGG